MNLRCAWILWVVLLTLAAGCGEPPTTAVVEGTVTVDGTPAEMGSIAFFPTDGKSATSGAALENGKYKAQVPFGEVKVEVRVNKVVGQQRLYDTPDSPVQPILAEVLPPKYNDQTELTMIVEPGVNQQNFDLTTK